MASIRIDYEDGDKGLCKLKEYLVLCNFPFSTMVTVEFNQCDVYHLNKFQEGTHKITLRRSSTKLLSNLPSTLKTLVLEDVPELKLIRGMPKDCRLVKLGKNINPELEVID